MIDHKTIRRMATLRADAEAWAHEQLTLSSLLHELNEYDGSRPVYLRDETGAITHPGRLHSYRGYYDHIAIEPGADRAKTIRDLRVLVRGSIGETYPGYKGGQFWMSEDTWVWAAEYGSSVGWRVVGVTPLITDDLSYAPMFVEVRSDIDDWETRRPED